MLALEANLPLSVRYNERKELIMWSAAVSAKYGWLHNEGEAQEWNPDEMVNVSLNVLHLRPLSAKWRLMATLGAGVYAMPGEIRWRSVLFNGGAVFIYKLRDNLDIGVGAGLTTSYGVPLVLPMLYFSWRGTGKYSFKVDFANGMRVAVSRRFGERFDLELTAIEIDGMSAVMEVEGKSKLYASMMLRSMLTATLRLDKRTSLYFGAGGNWMRKVSLRKRSWSSFWNDSDGEEHKFGPTFRISAGLRYGF